MGVCKQKKLTREKKSRNYSKDRVTLGAHKSGAELTTMLLHYCAIFFFFLS